MPNTSTRTLAMITVLETRAVGLHLVYVAVYRFISLHSRLGSRERIRVNNGRNTTSGLAYNHLARYLIPPGDVAVV